MDFRVEVSIKRGEKEMGYHPFFITDRNPRAAAKIAAKNADVGADETISQIRVYESIMEDGYNFKGDLLLTI